MKLDCTEKKHEKQLSNMGNWMLPKQRLSEQTVTPVSLVFFVSNLNITVFHSVFSTQIKQVQRNHSLELTRFWHVMWISFRKVILSGMLFLINLIHLDWDGLSWLSTLRALWTAELDCEGKVLPAPLWNLINFRSWGEAVYAESVQFRIQNVSSAANCDLGRCAVSFFARVQREQPWSNMK